MTLSIKKTYIKPSKNVWRQDIKLIELAVNNRLCMCKVFIAGKLTAIFDNMFDPWDLIDDGPEFLRELEASRKYYFTHKKTGAVVSNSLGPISHE